MSTVTPDISINELREQIRTHDVAYYNHDQPIISDAYYDELMRRLADLETQHPHLVDPNSPTQRVGGVASASFETVEHDPPMLGLANAFNLSDFEAWHARMVRHLGGDRFPMVAELKIDGLAIRLDYQDGELVLASTRGNGTTGEDVTHNVRTIRNVPLQLTGDYPGNLQIRGEVYMPISAFNQTNEDRESSGEYLYANPRNAAAGAIRQLDPVVASSRDLRMWVYSLNYVDDLLVGSHWENLDDMVGMGLPVNHRRAYCSDVSSVHHYYDMMLQIRDRLDYEADGIVVKVDSIEDQDELGVTGHDPRWAIAWKFPSEQVTTRLLDITISVGRFGKLTPMAVLEPVTVDGVVVQNASLHNYDDIHRKDIRAGDLVILHRAGGVIPQVMGPVDTNPDRSIPVFQMPLGCPKCDAPVTRNTGDADWWCANPRCGVRDVKSVQHLVSKDAMDIDGFGPVLCAGLVEAGYIENAGDVYHLTREQLLTMDHMGDKSVTQLLQNINDSRSRGLERVLYALGIFRLGHHVSALLANQYHSVEEVSALMMHELIEHDGIGPEIADAVYRGFRDQRTLDILDSMWSGGVIMERIDKGESTMDQEDQRFAGISICVTGTLQGMNRKEANAYIEQFGGKSTSSVTKSTNVLVVGESPGSKLTRANSLGITVWDEERFNQEIAIK